MVKTRTMNRAATPRNAEERRWEASTESLARAQARVGASRLDLSLDLDGSAASTGVHLQLSLETDAPRGAGAPAAPFTGDTTPDVVFGPRGHGAIVIIAMKDLEERRPRVKAKVDAILGDDPKERTDYFAAANWPDHVRLSRPETRPWHYVDIVYDPLSPDAPLALPEAPHAISGLVAMSEALRRIDDPEKRADALCFVLHIVGDIHQPFHCITRVTREHPAPEGDRGGNLFKLRGPYRNMHSLWDDSVNLMLQDTAEDIAAEIMKLQPRDGLERELAMKTPEAWVRAGYTLAVERGYKPLEDGAGDALRAPSAYLREMLALERAHESLEAVDSGAPRPSNTYLREARDLGQRQAALGGYRLADWLAEWLGG